jgi:hypothetical protein
MLLWITRRAAPAVQLGSNGNCIQSSTVDSTRFRVLDFG